MSYTVKLVAGFIGTALLVIFVVGLSHSISTGFAGFWGGFPFMLIIIVVLAWQSTTSGMNACAGTRE
jgi:hypothetical protein